MYIIRDRSEACVIKDIALVKASFFFTKTLIKILTLIETSLAEHKLISQTHVPRVCEINFLLFSERRSNTSRSSRTRVLDRYIYTCIYTCIIQLRASP